MVLFIMGKAINLKKCLKRQFPLSPTQFIEIFQTDQKPNAVVSAGEIPRERRVYRVGSEGQWQLHQSHEVTPTHVLAPEGGVTTSHVFTIQNEIYLLLDLKPHRKQTQWL